MQHSVGGAVAGALKKTYRLTILSEKVEGRGTTASRSDRAALRLNPGESGTVGMMAHSSIGYGRHSGLTLCA